MLSAEMAREQIQDRVRAAANDRRAMATRRIPTLRAGSGLLAAVASLRPRRRSSEEAPIRIARAAV